jgi:hypothetical protein
MLKRAKTFLHKGLLCRSDYPVPLSELCFKRRKNFLSWMRFVLGVSFVQSLLDKSYALIKAVGFKDSIFSNAAEILKQIKYSI